jgi:mannose-6-phosphate isomerase-like protein (cupin superfamily)
LNENTGSIFKTERLPEKYDYLAPDKSEIRNLLDMTMGGLAHCTLPPFSVSSAVKHKTVEEIWFFIEGYGEFWRKQGDNEEVTRVEPGICISISPEVSFQFRSLGSKALKSIIVTMPPWPGPQEAVPVKGRW